MRKAFVVLSIALLTAGTSAQIQLATTPGRESIVITVYKGADLSYVEETRRMTLKEGANLVRFSWADTRIDPLSIRLIPESPDVRVRNAVFPPGDENALIWEVDSKSAGEKPLKVSYFIGGLDWGISYTAVCSEEKGEMDLTAYATVKNESGEEFLKARLKLVAGEIHRKRVERYRKGLRKLAVQADRVRKMALEMRAGGKALAPSLAAAPPPAKFGMEEAGAAGMLSEHYLFSIDRPVDLRDEWSEKVAMFSAEDIPVKIVYVFESNSNRLWKEYRFENDEEHKLGRSPLPPGGMIIYRDEDGKLALVTSDAEMRFTPVGGEVEIRVEADPGVKVERKQISYAKVNLRFNDWGRVSGFDTEEGYEVRVRNHRDRAVQVELYEWFEGEWEIFENSHPFERKDVRTALFKLEVSPGAEEVVRYKVRIKREGVKR